MVQARTSLAVLTLVEYAWKEQVTTFPLGFLILFGPPSFVHWLILFVEVDELERTYPVGPYDGVFHNTVNQVVDFK